MQHRLTNADLRVGDVVRTPDGTHVRIVELEDDVKNGQEGGTGITIYDPASPDPTRPKRANVDHTPDRWFYTSDITLLRNQP